MMTKNEYKRIKKKFYFDVSYVVCGTALIMTVLRYCKTEKRN